MARMKSLKRPLARQRDLHGHCRAGATAFLFALLTFMLVVPAQSLAQGSLVLTHGEWEASFLGGGSFLGSGTYSTPVDNSGQSSSRAVGLKYDTGYSLGAAITENRWQHWGMTLEYNFANQPITFSNLSDSIPSLRLGHLIHRFAYDVLYYPLDRHQKLRPYLFAGPGVSLFYIKGSSKNEATALWVSSLSDPWKFTMNWGGGVKYLFKKPVAALFQFSDSISGVPGYGLPETGSVGSGGYSPGFRPDGLMNNWLISFGLNYQWNDR